jgi:hypothetical protein
MTPSEINHLVEQPFFNFAIGFLVASFGALIIDYILRSGDE